jgi:hypothetical protein
MQQELRLRQSFPAWYRYDELEPINLLRKDMFRKSSSRASCIEIDDGRITRIATQIVFTGGALSIIALVSLVLSRLA